jgi:hypothetical protein
VLPTPPGPPGPARPLGVAGLALWGRLWAAGAGWLSENVDSEQVLLVCEQLDERQALRLEVLRDKDWRARSGLRALERAITEGLAVLGFNPVDRSRLSVMAPAEVKRGGAQLNDLTARIAARRAAPPS